MIVITAHGRLAAPPTLKTLPNTVVCEFRLLTTRFAKGQEHTEAVNFFCFGEEAERFCESAEQGQLISATGTQETSNYTDKDGNRKSFVKYKMTWCEKGARPRASRQDGQAGGYERQQQPQPQPPQRQSQPQPQRHQPPPPQQYRQAPPQRPAPPTAPPEMEPPPEEYGNFDDVTEFF